VTLTSPVHPDHTSTTLLLQTDPSDSRRPARTFPPCRRERRAFSNS